MGRMMRRNIVMLVSGFIIINLLEQSIWVPVNQEGKYCRNNQAGTRQEVPRS